VKLIQNLVEYRESSGEPVSAHGYTVTPRARAIIIRLPRARFVWNRPVGVDVTQDGQTVHVPIGERNWMLPMAMLAVMATVIAVSLLARSRRPVRKETAT
jgi:hypothetical protein